MSALATETATVSTLTAPLVTAVKHALLAVPRRPAAPILAHVRVSAGAGSLEVSGYDFETAVTRAVDAEGALETVLVPGSALKDTLTRLDQRKDVSLSVEAGRLVITQGSRTVALKIEDPTEYPGLPTAPKDTVLETTGGQLAAMTQGLIPFTGKDDMLPVLTGIHLKLEGDTLVGEATDRFRAAYMHTLVLSRGDQLDVLVPHMTRVATVLGQDEPVTVSVKDQTIFFASATATISQRLLEGEFPKIRALFPSETTTVATLDPTAFLSALKFVEVGVARNEAVKVEVEEDRLRLVATDGDSQHCDTVPAAVAGGSLETGFNPKFLGEVVKVWGKTDPVRMRLTTPAKPALFESDSIPTLRVLLMPRRLVN